MSIIRNSVLNEHDSFIFLLLRPNKDYAWKSSTKHFFFWFYIFIERRYVKVEFNESYAQKNFWLNLLAKLVSTFRYLDSVSRNNLKKYFLFYGTVLISVFFPQQTELLIMNEIMNNFFFSVKSQKSFPFANLAKY